MSTNEIEDQLILLAKKHFNITHSDVRAGDDIVEALGIDSYKAMDLLTEVEDAFDVEIPDYELAKVRTFSALAAVVGRRL